MASDDDATLITSTGLFLEDADSVDDGVTLVRDRDEDETRTLMVGLDGRPIPTPAAGMPPRPGMGAIPRAPLPAAGYPARQPAPAPAPASRPAPAPPTRDDDPDRRVLPFGGYAPSPAPAPRRSAPPPRPPSMGSPDGGFSKPLPASSMGNPGPSMSSPVAAARPLGSVASPPAWQPILPPVAPSAPIASAPPSAPVAPAAFAPTPAPTFAPEPELYESTGTPRFVVRFLAACGVVTALGLVALVYLAI